MKLFRLFSVALLASTCLQVNAARIVGVGTSTCASYTKAIGTPTEAWYTSWAFGFISATNTTSSPDFLKDKDGDAILAALKLACESHPLNQFAGAADYVIKQLKSLTPTDSTAAPLPKPSNK
jgi:hypothetical protein